MRAFIAVIVGYIAMGLVVGLSLFGLYAVMKTEGAFQPGSYDVTTQWVVGMLVFGLLAAIVGGWVCAKISPTKGTIVFFIVVVLIMTVVNYFMVTGRPDPGPRTAEVPSMEAMQVALTPMWFHFVNPLIGIIGILIGGRKALCKD